jgi:hypothetical protein
VKEQIGPHGKDGWLLELMEYISRTELWSGLIAPLLQSIFSTAFPKEVFSEAQGD